MFLVLLKNLYRCLRNVVSIHRAKVWIRRNFFATQIHEMAEIKSSFLKANYNSIELLEMNVAFMPILLFANS